MKKSRLNQIIQIQVDLKSFGYNNLLQDFNDLKKVFLKLQ